MFAKKSLFFFVIFSFFISLFFIDAANAEPLTMSGSNQMSVNQSQTFTASGGYGGYTWSLEGNGTLSGTTGASVTYTAPATNPNCTNTKICVIDYRNKRYCKYIAINTNVGGVAYRIWTPENDDRCERLRDIYGSYYYRCYGDGCFWHKETYIGWFVTSYVQVRNYDCSGNQLGSVKTYHIGVNGYPKPPSCPAEIWEIWESDTWWGGPEILL